MSMTPDEVKAKSYLLKSDANGTSLYDHLVELISNTLEKNPSNIAQNPAKLPEFSQQTKKNAFRPHEKRVKEVYTQKVQPDKRVVERATEVKKLFSRPKPTVSTKVEQPTPNVTVTTTTVKPKRAPTYRSVSMEARYWDLIGIGLPEQQALLIDLAITKLASEKKLKDVRFFGKITGLQGDYIIVESGRWYPEADHKNYVEKHVMPDPPRKKVPVDVQPEPMGKGLNRYSYWVCSHPNGPWTHLPDVTPQQLNAARQIKKYFTGDLDAPVICYPEFPGRECNLLRAQIARIGAATQISPAGALNKHEDEDEDEEEEEEEEEGAPKKPKEEKTKPLTDPAEEQPELEDGIKTLENPEQWVHHYQYIYKIGRATKVPEKEVNEDEEEAEEEEEEEEKEKEEEEKELLEPVSKDKLYDKIIIPKEVDNEEGEDEEGKEEEPEEEKEEEEKDEDEEEEGEDDEEDPNKKRIPAWTCKMKNALYKNHGVVCVKSLRWPGAYAYAAEGGKAWGNIYMGNGLKATARQFAPLAAPEILKEADDLAEMVDPSAKNERLLLRGEELPEKDSEDEADAPEEEEEEEA